MSINDMLDSEATIPVMLMLLVIVAIFAIPVGIAMSKKINNNIYGDNEYGETKEEKNAKIMAIRTARHPLNQGVMINMAIFELENGNRLEFAIKDPTTYGIMVEGDCGTLKYQGKKFVSFERGSDNEA